MMNARLMLVSLTILLLLTLIPARHSTAQTGGNYDLTWNTIDGGSGSSTGGSYTLNGTTGQADAGNLAGGGYTLSGGFWIGTATALDHQVYLPLVLK